MSYDLNKIFSNSQKIAVVGISDKPDRSSYGVAEYLNKYYQVIPINPKLTNWKGIAAYADLPAAANNHKIDVVNIFRRSEEVLAVVESILALETVKYPCCIWMQLGVINEQAASLASSAGISVVMDACIAVLHNQWLRNRQ